MRVKKKFVGIVIFSVIVLIVTGTFAWSSFSSQTISLWFGEGAGTTVGSTDSGNQGTVAMEMVDLETRTREHGVLEPEEECERSGSESTEPSCPETAIMGLANSEYGAEEPGAFRAEEEDIEVGSASHGYQSENDEYASSGIGIIVHTAFSSDIVTDNIVDVVYTATPSMGAIITQVSYSINGHVEELLYQAGIDGKAQKGSLDEGRVLLVPGENEIVFIAKDSAGNIANYTVHQRPYYDFGTLPCRDMAFVEQMPSAPGASFVNNRVIAVANPDVSIEEVNSAAESIGGRITGQVNLLRWHIIEVDSQTEDSLLDICAELMETGLFSHVGLDMIYGAGNNTVHTNDS